MNTPHLIHLAEIFGAHRGWKLSTVSTYAAQDGKFFAKLRDGSGCTLKTAARLIVWFDSNWPSDLEWPKSIPRPQKHREVA